MYLNIKGKFFKQIAVGTKKKEYRNRTSYYKVRIGKKLKRLRFIWFMNEMSKNAPQMIVEYRGLDRCTRQYVLRLGKIINSDPVFIRSIMNN